MPDDTATPTRDRVAGATVAPILGAVRIGLPHDVLLEIVTGIAHACVEDPEVLERLVQLGDASAALENHDLRQELGDDDLQARLHDAQAPFRGLAAQWDLPLSEVRPLAVAMLTAWGDAGGTPPAVVFTRPQDEQ